MKDKTLSGELLNDLGRGVPAPGSGTKCDDCKGKGYFRYLNQPYVRCHSCYGHGVANHVSKGPTPCGRCEGTGKLISAKCTPYFIKCNKCRGCGEIEIFNPLIPKSLIA